MPRLFLLVVSTIMVVIAAASTDVIRVVRRWVSRMQKSFDWFQEKCSLNAAIEENREVLTAKFHARVTADYLGNGTERIMFLVKFSQVHT